MNRQQKSILREIARGRDKERFYAVARHLLSSWGKFPKNHHTETHIDIDDFISRFQMNQKIHRINEKSTAAIANGDYKNVDYWFYCKMVSELDPYWRYSDDSTVLRNGQFAEDSIAAVKAATGYEYDPLYLTTHSMTYVKSYLGIDCGEEYSLVMLHPKMLGAFKEYIKERDYLKRKVSKWRLGREHIEPTLKNRHLPKNVRYLYTPESERRHIYALTDRAIELRDSYAHDNALISFPDHLCYDVDTGNYWVDFSGDFTIYIN